MGAPRGMVCHEGESVPDGEGDVRDAVIGRGGRAGGGGPEGHNPYD